MMEEISSRIETDGGTGLVIDYGHDGTKTDTIRGFKDHALHDVLCEPGTADLTADVDFSYLRHSVQDKVDTFGPVNQNIFLSQMGIQTRLQKLIQSANPDHHKDLISGYRMIMDPEQMGERFQAFSLIPKNRDEQHYSPAGFHITR